MSGLSCPTGSTLVCHVEPFFPEYQEVLFSQEMTCFTPWGRRSEVGLGGRGGGAAGGRARWEERHSKFLTPWYFSPLWAWQNVSSHSQCWLDWAVIVMVCERECVCLWVCVCIDWLWLNTFCGIYSDYGWASLLCNETNWLTSRVGNWTEFLLCWVLSTCQPGAEKWEAGALRNRRKNSSSGSSPSILLYRQLYSQRERGHTDDRRADPLSARTSKEHNHYHCSCVGSWHRADPPRTPPNGS